MPRTAHTRRRFRAIAITSVVVEVLVLLAAIASFPWVVELNRGDSWWTLENGRFRVGWYYVPRNRRGVEGWHADRNDAIGWDWPMQVPRVRLSGGPFAFVNIPRLWIPIALFSGVVVAAYRGSHGFGPGRCPNCGYDLSGIATAACPECGPVDVQQGDEA